jgi:hypothetical protein
MTTKQDILARFSDGAFLSYGGVRAALEEMYKVGRASVGTQLGTESTKLYITELVNRFLSWPLPKSVCADLCATKPDCGFPRSGTNLLTADQARQMIEHLLGLASATPASPPPGKTRKII